MTIASDSVRTTPAPAAPPAVPPAVPTAPVAVPVATPVPAPVATLAYQSGLDRGRMGQSRWAVASWVLTSITVIYCVVCFIGMTQAKGWDGLAWLIVGLYGNWIGFGLAAACALVGVVQRRKRRRLAIHALWVSLLLGLGPIALIWLGMHF